MHLNLIKIPNNSIYNYRYGQANVMFEAKGLFDKELISYYTIIFRMWLFDFAILRTITVHKYMMPRQIIIIYIKSLLK